MKTLSQTIVPAPQLDAFQLEKLSSTIDQLQMRIRSGRKERVQKVVNARRSFQEDFSHRVEPNSIFQQSNIGVPLMKGIATSFTSKFEDELFSAENPFFARAENIEDKTEAEKFSKYWNWELMTQMRYRATGNHVLLTACSEGTAVTKRSWRMLRSYYSRTERQIFDETGQPLLGPDGKPVKADHPTLILPHPNPMRRMLGAKIRVLDFGEGVQGPELLSVHQIQDVKLKDFVTHFNNAQCKLIPFEDFICEINAETIDDSPLVAHDYEIRYYDLIERIAQQIEGKTSVEEIKAAGWYPDAMRQLKDTAHTPSRVEDDVNVTTAKMIAPMRRWGEVMSTYMGLTAAEELYKSLQFSEVYLKYDVDDDNIMEDVVVLYEKTGKKVVWCDYLANVYADCKSPFNVHSFFQVPGRWWGLGPYEYLKTAQEFVDKVFNRMNYRTAMAANPMGWSKPDHFIKPPAMWGPGEKVELKSAHGIADSMGFMVMPSVENVEWKHFEFFISLIQMITGISNASQGDIGSIPSTATATGITSIVEEGNKLFRMFIRRFKDSFEDEMKGLVRLIQQNIDENRVFRYNQGFQEVVQVVRPEDIRELDFDVRIVLTKSGQQQKSMAIRNALGIVAQWMQMPPEYQVRLRDIFIQLLQSTGIVEAETILPTVEELQGDQDKDAMLEEIRNKIGAAAQQIAGGDLDPKKQVAQDLMGLTQILSQMIAKPPEAASGASPQAEGPPRPGVAASNELPPHSLTMAGEPDQTTIPQVRSKLPQVGGTE